MAADGMTWIFPPDYFMCSVVVWISFLFKKRKIWKDRVRDIDVVDRKALVVHAVWSILKLCFLKKEKKKQITTCRGSSQNNGYRRNWHPVPSNNRPGRERHGLLCCRQPLPARYIYRTVLCVISIYIISVYTISTHIYVEPTDNIRMIVGKCWKMETRGTETAAEKTEIKMISRREQKHDNKEILQQLGAKQSYLVNLGTGFSSCCPQATIGKS